MRMATHVLLNSLLALRPLACRRPPSLRELKRWARLLVELCARGWDAPAALAASFVHVYVRPEHDGEARARAHAAFHAHCQTHSMWAVAQPWMQPATWPIHLTAAQFAASSGLAATSRDAQPLLFWAGQLASAALELQDGTALASRVPAALSAAGLAATAMLSGRLLSSGLLCAPDSSLAEGILEVDAAYHPSMLLAATKVYAERGALECGGSMYGPWAAALLRECAELAQGLGADGEVGAMCQLATRLLHALLPRLAATSNVALRFGDEHAAALHSAAAAAAVLDGCAAATDVPATLLQLSCVRFLRATVGRHAACSAVSLGFLYRSKLTPSLAGVVRAGTVAVARPTPMHRLAVACVAGPAGVRGGRAAVRRLVGAARTQGRPWLHLHHSTFIAAGRGLYNSSSTNRGG